MEMYIGVDPDETGLPTRSVYFDCRHITRIEPSPQGVPGSNGDGPQDAQE